MEKIFLGDGSEAVKLEDEPYTCLDAARSYDGAVWIVYDKSSTIVVRHAESGEDLFVVELTEERPRCIASVPAMRHIWVSTDAGNMHVYEQTGALVGVFRSSETSGIVAIHASAVEEQPGRLFTTYADGTAVAWDAEVFRPFSTRFAGNGTPVRCVVPLNTYLCVVGNSAGLWIWNVVSGMTTLSVKTNPVSAAAVVHRPCHPSLSFLSGLDAISASLDGGKAKERQSSNQSKFFESPLTPKCVEVWVTAGDWIEVYEASGGGSAISAALADGASMSAIGEFSSGAIALTQRYRVPCPKPLSLTNISSRHISSVDKEGYVTVWDGWLRCPVRMFKLDGAPGSLSSLPSDAACKTLCLAASHVLTTSVWCLYGRKGMLWTNVIDDAYNWQESDRRDELGGEGSLTHTRATSVKGNQASFLDESKLSPAALLKDEVRFLRRKDAILTNILSEYRSKTVKLARAEIGTAATTTTTTTADRSEKADNTSTANNDSRAWARTLLALDKATGDALATWRTMASDEEPLVSRRGLPPTAWDESDCNMDPWEMVEYWKKKYSTASTSISALREWNHDLQRATEDLKHALSSFCNESDAGSGKEQWATSAAAAASAGGKGEENEESVASVTARLSLRICELIRSYSEIDSKEADLRAHIESLEKQLSKRGASQSLSAFNSFTGGVVPYSGQRSASATSEREREREPSPEAQQREIFILRQRLQDANVEIDRLQHQLAVESVTWQNHVRQMSEAMTGVQRELADTSTRERVFDSSSQSLRTQVDELKAALAAAKRDYNEVAEAQHKRQCELQQRLTEMEELSAGTARLVSRKSEELRVMEMKLHIAEKAQEKTRVLTAELHVKDAEVETLKEELARLKEMLAEHHPRNDPTSTMEELQKRFENVVTDFKSSFAPSRVGDQISQLTDRLTKHYRLATQLKEKDDELAGKDDEIMMLREALTAAEERAEAVSTVFGGLPLSVQDVEKLMLELDEYRKRYGTSNEIHELVELRSLDIASRRRVYDLAEDSFPMQSLFGSTSGAAAAAGVGGGFGAYNMNNNITSNNNNNNINNNPASITSPTTYNPFNSSELAKSFSISGMSAAGNEGGNSSRPAQQIAGYPFA